MSRLAFSCNLRTCFKRHVWAFLFHSHTHTYSFLYVFRSILCYYENIEMMFILDIQLLNCISNNTVSLCLLDSMLSIDLISVMLSSSGPRCIYLFTCIVLLLLPKQKHTIPMRAKLILFLKRPGKYMTIYRK